VTNVLLLFPTNSGTMIATKMLRDCGVVARVIPTPASVSSPSNLCLSIDDTAESAALAALENAKVTATVVR
jgi:hypothetical protein